VGEGGGGTTFAWKKKGECWYIFHIPPPPCLIVIKSMVNHAEMMLLQHTHFTVHSLRVKQQNSDGWMSLESSMFKWQWIGSLSNTNIFLTLASFSKELYLQFYWNERYEISYIRHMRWSSCDLFFCTGHIAGVLVLVSFNIATVMVADNSWDPYTYIWVLEIHHKGICMPH